MDNSAMHIKSGRNYPLRELRLTCNLNEALDVRF